MKRTMLLIVLLCLIGSLSSHASPQEYTVYLPLVASSRPSFSNFRVSTSCKAPAQTTFLQGQSIYVLFDYNPTNLGEALRISVMKMPSGSPFLVFFPPIPRLPPPCKTITVCGLLAEGLALGSYKAECVALPTSNLVGRFFFTVIGPETSN
jgi:hypothetical protein